MNLKLQKDVGAIDSTHIPIIRLEESPVDYYNRKVHINAGVG